MLAGKRSARVGEQVRREIAELIEHRVKDPRIRGVTLTGVSMADDLKSAKVYFSVLGEDVDPEKVQGGLQSAKGFIKREIGRRLELRYVPDLEFRHDPSLVRGVEMEKLLESLDPDEPGEGEV